MHKSFVMNRSHIFDLLDEISAIEAQPEGFDAGFAVVFAPQETTQHGNLPNHLAQGGRCRRGRLLGQEVRTLTFFLGKQLVG